MFERNRIAETLRSAREEKGLSLEQAAAAASVPQQYARLLEGETNVRIGVSDEFYLIPFFRRYASFVGLDAEELLPEFLGVVQHVPTDTSPPMRLAYRPRWIVLWKPLALLATIAVAVALFLRASHERPPLEDGARSDAPGAVATIAVRATIAPTSIALGTTEEPTPDATPATTATTAADGGGHELRITAREEAWLSLALDEEQAKQYLLRAEESRTWRADRFTLTVGNAGGITLAFDGRELAPIGRPGQVVRNLRFPDAAGPNAASTPG
jgi:cytoskeletal protein RodZ